MSNRTAVGVVCVAAISIVLTGGCAQSREEAAIVMAKDVAMKVIDKANIEQSQLAASARITNPRYHAKGFVGVGAHFDFEVGATGVDVEADVRGAGQGQAPTDLDLREKLFRIMANRELSQEQRRQFVMQALTGIGEAGWRLIEEAIAALRRPTATQPSTPAVGNGG